MSTKKVHSNVNITTGSSLTSNNVITNSMPYKDRITGTVTTNGSGAATIAVNGWGWGNFPSHRRGGLVSVYIHNNTNEQQISQIYHSVGWFMNLLNGAGTANSVGWGATCTFTADVGNGGRYFTLASASASTVYNYTIQFIPFSDAITAGI
jgi:hypothetical protein